MLYYLGLLLRSDVSLFNVFTYHTVRAGGAAVTAFAVSLLIGPTIIRLLRSLKVGQYIRKEHVADLHALHKSKAGTPTMGGALIILAALISLAFWGRFTNRLLLMAILAMALLGAVGFLDDYMKLRRKHNQGLSAKAKMAGQLIVGIGMGLYLVYSPIAVSATYLATYDILDWERFGQLLRNADPENSQTPADRLVDLMAEPARTFVLEDGGNQPWGYEARTNVLHGLESSLRRHDLYDPEAWTGVALTPEAEYLLADGPSNLSERELLRLNRLLVEAALPDLVASSPPDMHTKVEIPGLKMVLIPMGILYVFFVLMIIVGSSNAVNLTDGLDGLAIGASIISLLAYTGIAYVVSRADWSQYLYLIHVPEASELTVFGGAMLGAGLGFLWFNSHPAEVFMGDTGSLALGGALGTMAILTKQELLLVIVGGLFVVEALSVIIQVASFKLRGKRVFKMAPLHHHFELLGWSESKVTVRFWIIAIVFALMSLATLKLR
ncbi:MAG: phospho-N-acetylmuramoyl-pentapeptide-transferase [Candidatus Hydrogenedentes bacterium]|nr:phospho-N-acetylmuramoyl-pentapeptide-transferase [Candidatus Hydrogenedentota bacterium]